MQTIRKYFAPGRHSRPVAHRPVRAILYVLAQERRAAELTATGKRSDWKLTR